MNYLVAVVAFVLFSLASRLPWKVPSAVLSLFFLAVSIVYAASTGVYGWLRDNAVAPVFGWFGGLIGASGTQVAGALVLIGAVTVVVVLLSTKSMSREVVIGLALCGFLVSLAAGPVAQGVGNATDGVETAGEQTVSRWIGA